MYAWNFYFNFSLVPHPILVFNHEAVSPGHTFLHVKRSDHGSSSKPEVSQNKMGKRYEQFPKLISYTDEHPHNKLESVSDIVVVGSE